jgi:type II secretory pathway predicted ATPase ExeA
MQYPDRKPTALKLKALLKRLGVPQARFARSLGISPGTLADILNWGCKPSKGWSELRLAMQQELAQLGAPSGAIATAFDHRAQAVPKKQNAQRSSAERSTVTPSSATSSTAIEKETDMLLQKQTMHQATRRHFAVAADPFNNDIAESGDVFVSPDIRYVRETLWQHAKHGGLLALVGESGSGKSTTVADFKDRLQREGRDVIIIEPSVLYMEENDSKGKTLKSAAIVQAIIATIAPSVPPKRDAEARARQVQQLLTAGYRAGQRHVLIIEEAHCLPTATLKHLKRFAELKDGLAPLLSIVLVGQPELRQRLAVNNAEVREVAQRCDLVELPALDNNLGDYLKFKLNRVGCALDKVITQDGIDALRERLTFARRTGNGKAQVMTTSVSLVYPLAVANALTAAMNLAASLGAPVVDADIVKEA